MPLGRSSFPWRDRKTRNLPANAIADTSLTALDVLHRPPGSPHRLGQRLLGQQMPSRGCGGNPRQARGSRRESSRARHLSFQIPRCARDLALDGAHGVPSLKTWGVRQSLPNSQRQTAPRPTLAGFLLRGRHGFAGGGLMAVPRKSFRREQPPAKPDPPSNPASDRSPLGKIAKGDAGGPGRTWVNLTKEEVEEKLGRRRRHQVVTNQGSFWQRLAGVFRRSSNSD